MNLLARLDPGDAVTRAGPRSPWCRSSVVILLAALLARIVASPACRRAARPLAGRAGLGLDQSGRGRRRRRLGPCPLGRGLCRSQAPGAQPGRRLREFPTPWMPPTADPPTRTIERVDAGRTRTIGPSRPRSLAQRDAEPVADEAARRRRRSRAGGATPSSGSWLCSGRRVCWPASSGSPRAGGGSRRCLARHSRSIPCGTARPSSGSAMRSASPRCPPVVTSPTAAGPVAVGLFRPRVVLPEGLAESISSALRCATSSSTSAPTSSATTRGSACCNAWRRALLAAPAGSLPQRPARAGSRGGLRQPRAPVRRRLRLRPHPAWP